MKRWKLVVPAALAVVVFSRGVRAEERACANVTRSNVVSCALAASMAVRAEERGVSATSGRRTAAGVVLPSNPSLAFNLATPTEPQANQSKTLYSATLSQELEIAGQRGARIDVAEAEQRGQQSRLAAARRDIAAAALSTYFDQLAAVEEQRIAHRLMNLAQALKGYSGARAEIGLAAPVDAVIAEAEAVQLTARALDAEQRLAETSAALTTLVGLDPAAGPRARVEGTLTPIAPRDASVQALATAASASRPEVLAALAERRREEGRARVLRRARIPNPTLSIFLRRDWIEERTIGVGLSFPIPLPSPIGRTNAGEIDEANALAQRAEADAERLRRETRLDVVQAAEAFARRKQAAERFDPEVVRKAEQALGAIADELAVRKLALRDALVMQRSLIDLLFGYVEARRRLCLASVELARVSGVSMEAVSFEGGAR